MDTGIRLLGAAVGDRSFTHQQLAAAIQKIKLLTAELPRLECSMSQYCLLRSTLSLTKFAYLLRTVNTSAHRELLEDFDFIQREALNELLGTAINHTGYDQAALPVSAGGLGLRKSIDHHNVAFTASVCSSLNLICRLIGSGAEHEDCGRVEDSDRVEDGGPEEVSGQAEVSGRADSG